jgi:glycogen debranching enzyme
MLESLLENLQYSIQASGSRADDRTRVLKHGETFAVFDHYCDVHPTGLGEQGLYHEGTRFVSRLEFLLFNERPMLLNSNVKEDNALLTVDLTNPSLYHGGQLAVQSGSLHIFHAKLLWNGSCCSHIRFTNYGAAPLRIGFCLKLDADFADIFEVRGMKRARHGHRLADVVDDSGFTMAYEGLDGVVRRTRVSGYPNPTTMRPGMLCYEFLLEAKSSENFFTTISCLVGDQRTPRPLEYHDALTRVIRALDHYNRQSCQVQTSHEPFNDWLGRSHTDLFMMVSQTDYGAYPFAGVPWFSTIFGRDGLITALESLWVNPDLAKGVLNTLAASQAREVNAAQDSEPGKILHEMRKGEMARLGEIPFGRYYGSVDSTPLFVMLAAAYFEATADQEFIEAICRRSTWRSSGSNTTATPMATGLSNTSGPRPRGWCSRGGRTRRIR